MERPRSRSFTTHLPSLVAAIVVSLVAHLSVGLAFARRPRAPVVTFVAAPADASWEIAAPDLACPPAEPNAPAVAATEPSAVEHHGSRAAEPHAVREPSPTATAHGEPSAPPDVVTTPEASGPRFVMGSVAPTQVPSGPVAATGAGQRGGTSTAPVGTPPAAPLAEQAVDVPARLVSGAPPAYTPAAEAAGSKRMFPWKSSSTAVARCWRALSRSRRLRAG